MALTYTPAPELGAALPTFSLPGTDGKFHTLRESAAPGYLVMFICNHCPYVKAIEDRLVKLGHDYMLKGLQMLAISSNDAVNYPDDSFEKMKLKPYPFAYCVDETQEVARAFGAVCTPDFFLYDASMKLVYRGRLDNSWKDASQVTTRELATAIDTVLAGQMPAVEQKASMGCNIKWSTAVSR